MRGVAPSQVKSFKSYEKNIRAQAMSRFERRLIRLEERINPKPGAQHVLITNVPPEDAVESPFLVRISANLWAEAIGRPFTAEEIADLKERYNGGNADEPES
jgi:hypothetical protein